ncbi:lytic transglycosylase domain-containing protein [Shimia biformata]|uniref:lytic transglycosylase domain-containing protein n=1 Tax=Shimia biformata TaxID=1294299 RepID=UPI00194E9AA1|nr:lytic transglycosylase domain-containing protein [Shimia biformata]
MIGFCVVSALISTPLGAEGPKPFPDFKAKRVKPPKPGTAKRITVQIEPAPVVAPKPKATADAGTTKAKDAPPGSRYAWFWETISPEMAQSAPGRLQKALDLLSAPPGGEPVAAPRLQFLAEIARRHGVDILKSTVGTEVSPALVLAMISVESSGRVDAVSSAGAQGLMQLMPATAARFGVPEDPDAADNIRGGVAFLNFLMSEFDRDPILVLAGYNAGENAVKGHSGVPPFAETRDYVPKVLAAYAVARGLCRTPPELITDGCVFATN